MDAFNGFDHDAGGAGGENRTGGDAANGMPRYLLTATVAEGRIVVVPTITPDATVTVGSTAETRRVVQIKPPSSTHESWWVRYIMPVDPTSGMLSGKS